MLVGVSDKLLMGYLENKKYLNCSDEGEAIGIGIGYYFGTGSRATVFMSADGFMNALNPLTSCVIPDKVEMNLVISVGRKEPQHREATRMLIPLLELLEYDHKRIHIELIEI